MTSLSLLAGRTVVSEAEQAWSGLAWSQTKKDGVSRATCPYKIREWESCKNCLDENALDVFGHIYQRMRKLSSSLHQNCLDENILAVFRYIQTSLLSYREWLENLNFAWSK